MENRNEIIKKVIDDFEYALIKIVLFCISEVSFSLGIKKTIDILRGNKNTFAINYELNKLETFSLLSSFSKDQLRTIIEILIKNELLHIEYVSKYANLPVLRITEKGKEVLNNNEIPRLFIIDSLTDKEILEFIEIEKNLFKELRKLRKEIAQKNDLPAFIICSDNVLREICFKKPKVREELIKIKGIGEKFVDKYGEKFLESINIILDEQ